MEIPGGGSVCYCARALSPLNQRSILPCSDPACGVRLATAVFASFIRTIYWFGGGKQQPKRVAGMVDTACCWYWWLKAFLAYGDSQEDYDVLVWGLDSHPPGGFVNMLKSTPQVASNRTASQAIHIDSDNNDADHSRSEKRLTWTKGENLKLVSAWLMNSNDLIQANYKKNDQYWNGVVEGFNRTVPKNRVRSAKQVKDHWWRIKLRVGWFCGNWKEADSMWGSGESEDDVMKKAPASYEEDHKKDDPFAYKHCWEVLSKEPKWEAYLERLKDLEPEKRKFSVDEEVEQQFSLDDVRDERPMGGRKAKELRKKKKKDQPSIIDIEDELHNFLDAQKAANEGRTEMLETQRHVSSEKLESRRLAHLAAKENKEAVMLETYRSLLTQDTTGMDEDVKAEHVLALRCLRESLF
ncbi:unnamed protein product [Miscanthus lutarioriparius]|uniref:No apical meristem-associated C-terminal domain-containing protein n=1 Tax=Miscanthus lutarioriparius TaxID=422564 RepID=A0A811S1H1_9POAL|nr:unnamed protein product [Miscanthus lutarioriparius]